MGAAHCQLLLPFCCRDGSGPCPPARAQAGAPLRVLWAQGCLRNHIWAGLDVAAASHWSAEGIPCGTSHRDVRQMQKGRAGLGRMTSAVSEAACHLVPHTAPLLLATSTTKAISGSRVGWSHPQAGLVVCAAADSAGLTVSRGWEELQWLLRAQIPVTRGNWEGGPCPSWPRRAQAPQQMGHSSLCSLYPDAREGRKMGRWPDPDCWGGQGSCRSTQDPQLSSGRAAASHGGSRAA